MGWCVEYFVRLPPAPAREWLSALKGFWIEVEGDPPYGELTWDGLPVHASLESTACKLSALGIRYSWLVRNDAPAVEWVSRFEGWLVQSLPGTRMVRVDEFFRGTWETQTGREWEQWLDPVAALQEWLKTTEQDAEYYRILGDET